MGLDTLIGVTIVSVQQVGDDLRLETTSGPILLEAIGDCCSHTWIESVDDPVALCGTVTAVEELVMPDLGTPQGSEHRQYYGVKITTECGRAVIDFRNDSNGYYGGWLSVQRLDGPPVLPAPPLGPRRIRV